MSAYIKLSTKEYPRHIGDIAIDPAGERDYALVEWVDQPEFDPVEKRCYEGQPEQTKTGWRMTWIVRDATEQEKQKALEKPIIPLNFLFSIK